jgi:hypothetical protein
VIPPSHNCEINSRDHSRKSAPIIDPDSALSHGQGRDKRHRSNLDSSKAKDQMKKRGMHSPDEGDAVAFSFSEPGGSVSNATFHRPILGSGSV